MNNVTQAQQAITNTLANEPAAVSVVAAFQNLLGETKYLEGNREGEYRIHDTLPEEA